MCGEGTFSNTLPLLFVSLRGVHNVHSRFRCWQHFIVSHATWQYYVTSWATRLPSSSCCGGDRSSASLSRQRCTLHSIRLNVWISNRGRWLSKTASVRATLHDVWCKTIYYDGFVPRSSVDQNRQVLSVSILQKKKKICCLSFPTIYTAWHFRMIFFFRWAAFLCLIFFL